MARITIKKVNNAIHKFGYELQRGNGYYYFSPLSDFVKPISEQGLYGSRLLSAWTVDELVSELKLRIEKNN